MAPQPRSTRSGYGRRSPSATVVSRPLRRCTPHSPRRASAARASRPRPSHGSGPDCITRAIVRHMARCSRWLGASVVAAGLRASHPGSDPRQAMGATPRPRPYSVRPRARPCHARPAPAISRLSTPRARTAVPDRSASGPSEPARPLGSSDSTGRSSITARWPSINPGDGRSDAVPCEAQHRQCSRP